MQQCSVSTSLIASSLPLHIIMWDGEYLAAYSHNCHESEDKSLTFYEMHSKASSIRLWKHSYFSFVSTWYISILAEARKSSGISENVVSYAIFLSLYSTIFLCCRVSGRESGQEWKSIRKNEKKNREREKKWRKATAILSIHHLSQGFLGRLFIGLSGLILIADMSIVFVSSIFLVCHLVVSFYFSFELTLARPNAFS